MARAAGRAHAVGRARVPNAHGQEWDMTIRATLLGLATAAFAAVAIGGTPAIAQQPAGKIISDVKERKTLRVGMASFVPWAMRDKQGNWIGFEIDVAKKFASDLGVELELMPTAWDGTIPALAANK